eukprot:gene3399-5944_t
MTVLFVIQRVESASLLIDNVDKYVNINKGVIIHLSILKETKKEDLEKIVKTLSTTKYYINEDGKPCSIQEVPCDILIVPQASLAGKIKQKNVQYHSLIEKSGGKEIYDAFVEMMKSTIHEKSILQSGVYGNRQGLKFISEGPFTHSFEL